MPAEQALRRLVDSGHSRAPVTGPIGLDDVAGVVHLRDLVNAAGQVVDHTHPAVFLPETLKVSDALRQMRQQRQQFALVLDERGANDGIVTMEDLVEEVVGEIYDETDRDIQAVVREPDGAMLLVGDFPIHDLPDIGVDVEGLEDGDYTTVTGLILARLGHFPTSPGERVDLSRYTVEVAEITGHAITRVRLGPRPTREQPSADQAERQRPQPPPSRP